ncbi:hypothetical protein [Anaerosolibacter carboniphilus]|nr:hypothetical protein [Anaerosolibacter carboniphilus]
MEMIHKYDDERIYAILLAGLEKSLPENIYEYAGLEEMDIINIVVENITKQAIEGICTVLMNGEDSEIEYETEFVILFNEDDLVIDVQISLEALAEQQ